MALQVSDAVRNAMIDAFETAVGATAVLKIYDLTAGAPANTSAAIAATVLVSMTLPADWMDAAASGSKSKLGTWSATGTAAGTADFFRIFAADGTTCHAQGTVTATGGGGVMTLDNPIIVSGQPVTISTFTLTGSNP